MATEQMLQFSVESMVEDVLKQHGTRLSDRDLASRKAEEASLRRSEAAGWLRKTVGVVGGKDLPAEPSEEEFRLALRSGIILCNVLNKVQPGAIPKVVEGPGDSVIIPDGAALSAYQYFENVRNFLVAIEDMGLPTFEASDMEQGGKSCRIVNSILALKSYSEWKQGGGHGSWKFGGNLKPTSSGKYFIRKNSEAFMNSFSRSSSASEKFLESLTADQSFTDDLGHELNEASKSGSLHTLVCQILSDKKQEDIPLIMESMLTKVMQEFERRLSSQNGVCNGQGEMKIALKTLPEERFSPVYVTNENLEGQQSRQRMLVEQQDKDIQVLKNVMCTTKGQIQLLQAKYMEDISIIGNHLQSVAYAASGYQKVLEENRRLYNQVQDLKGNIRVYCRVRPFLSGQSNRPSTVDRIDEGNISITTSLKNGKEGRKSFTFNKVFGPSATQEEVFSDTKPLVRSVLDGYNVCIFAYGQTGSGKTYTMTGPRDLTEENVGVNFRALSDLFLFSEQRRDTIHYDVTVQMIEIYNEQVRDLLVTDGQNKKVEIRNSAQNGINVPDANIFPVSSTSDVLYLMNLGHSNRAVGATALNDRSSRSHSCLMVHVQGRELTTGTIFRGCMHLVDLAGSERVDKSEVTGDRLKEAQHINKSLSALGDVISSLAQKNSHVPYRNSKLTQLLQDSLGGQAKTLMFVHISPEPDAHAETISTLKFAERVSTVELGAARANKDSVEVKDLKEQIANLKAALAKKDGEVEHRYSSRPCSPERFIASPAVASDLSSLGSGDIEVTHRQPMEDVGNIEVQNKLTPKPKIQSFDIQDALFNSPSWPPVSGLGGNGKDDEAESVCGEWVDKIMVKKYDGVSGGENPPVIWEADNRELPQMYYQKIPVDPSRIHKESTLSKSSSLRRNNLMNDVQNGRYDAVTDESDELDAGTSDSSEHDLLWQFNASKANKNGPGSKMKKPNSKPAKSQETRSLIPSLIPTPSRKLSNGVSPTLQKPRQTVAVDGRRRNGTAK